MKSAVRPCASCGVAYEAIRGTYRYCEVCRYGKCVECNGRFLKWSPATRFCSLVCRSKFRFRGKRIVVPCARCGAEVSRPMSDWTRKGIAFCSRKCRNQYYWADPASRAIRVASAKASPSCYTEARKAQLNAVRFRNHRDEGFRSKIRAARMRQRFPTEMTNIERALHDAFKARGLPFEMHRSLFGRWQPDFVFESPRVIVQADGDYWHSRPAAIDNDRRFNEAAKEAGWNVLRFLGSRIKADLGGCVADTCAAIQERTPRIDLSA